nr:MAG: hypothetical protein [Totiviridae sp.]
MVLPPPTAEPQLRKPAHRRRPGRSGQPGSAQCCRTDRAAPQGQTVRRRVLQPCGPWLQVRSRVLGMRIRRRRPLRPNPPRMPQTALPPQHHPVARRLDGRAVH